MSPGLHVALVAAIVAAAGLVVRIPRALFAQIADGAPEKRLEWTLAAALAVTGVAVFEAAGQGAAPGRFALALCAIVLLAVVYADLTYLVIPDLYSLLLLIVAFVAPWRLPLGEAVIGAAVGGGLLLAVAIVWRKLTSVDGLGYGDAKLAAAIGALLGAQTGLLAISVSAALAAVLVYGLRRVKGRDVAPLVPYGAALAIAGGGFLGTSVL